MTTYIDSKYPYYQIMLEAVLRGVEIEILHVAADPATPAVQARFMDIKEEMAKLHHQSTLAVAKLAEKNFLKSKSWLQRKS